MAGRATELPDVLYQGVRHPVCLTEQGARAIRPDAESDEYVLLSRFKSLEKAANPFWFRRDPAKGGRTLHLISDVGHGQESLGVCVARPRDVERKSPSTETQRPSSKTKTKTKSETPTGTGDATTAAPAKAAAAKRRNEISDRELIRLGLSQLVLDRRRQRERDQKQAAAAAAAAAAEGAPVASETKVTVSPPKPAPRVPSDCAPYCSVDDARVALRKIESVHPGLTPDQENKALGASWQSEQMVDKYLNEGGASLAEIYALEVGDIVCDFFRILPPFANDAKKRHARVTSAASNVLGALFPDRGAYIGAGGDGAIFRVADMRPAALGYDGKVHHMDTEPVKALKLVRVGPVDTAELGAAAIVEATLMRSIVGQPNLMHAEMTSVDCRVAGPNRGGRLAGVVALLMDLGISMDTWLAEAPEAKRPDILLRVAQELHCAMEYLWRNGIVHRNLAPANVIFVRVDDSEVETATAAEVGLSDQEVRDQIRAGRVDPRARLWRAKISDFGLAQKYLRKQRPLWDPLNDFSRTEASAAAAAREIKPARTQSAREVMCAYMAPEVLWPQVLRRTLLDPSRRAEFARTGVIERDLGRDRELHNFAQMRAADMWALGALYAHLFTSGRVTAFAPTKMDRDFENETLRALEAGTKANPQADRALEALFERLLVFRNMTRIVAPSKSAATAASASASSTETKGGSVGSSSSSSSSTVKRDSSEVWREMPGWWTRFTEDESDELAVKFEADAFSWVADEEVRTTWGRLVNLQDVENADAEDSSYVDSATRSGVQKLFDGVFRWRPSARTIDFSAFPDARSASAACARTDNLLSIKRLDSIKRVPTDQAGRLLRSCATASGSSSSSSSSSKAAAASADSSCGRESYGRVLFERPIPGVPARILGMANEIFYRYTCSKDVDFNEAQNDLWLHLAILLLAAKVYGRSHATSLRWLSGGAEKILRRDGESDAKGVASTAGAESAGAPLTVDERKIFDALANWNALDSTQRQTVDAREKLLLKGIDWRPDSAHFYCGSKLSFYEDRQAMAR